MTLTEQTIAVLLEHHIPFSPHCGVKIDEYTWDYARTKDMPKMELGKYAIEHNLINLVRITEDRGLSPSDMLRVAIIHGRTEIVELLLKTWKHSDYALSVAMDVAVRKGYLDIVKLLPITEATLSGCSTKTPLMIAAKYGHIEIVKYLLQVGADPCVTHCRGGTAVYHAIVYICSVIYPLQNNASSEMMVEIEEYACVQLVSSMLQMLTVTDEINTPGSKINTVLDTVTHSDNASLRSMLDFAQKLQDKQIILDPKGLEIITLLLDAGAELGAGPPIMRPIVDIIAQKLKSV